MKLKLIIYSIATFVPGINQLLSKGRGGTDSARYCYSVWLRHLVMSKSNGLNTFPQTVAELGPGGSLGVGIAALISGCDKYLAFDVVEHANIERNLKIFDEILLLFQHKTAIPGEDEFPDVKPYLNKYDFPGDIFDEERLHYALDVLRLQKIRNSIEFPRNKESLIQYKAPWYDASIIELNSVNMVYSQAVLEHVDDLLGTYKSMYLWLKPDGYMSHQIDFRSHGTADEWNGHWTYSDFMWKIIKGKRAYLLNREPYSTHIAIMKKEGFKIAGYKKIKARSSLSRDKLALKFHSLTDDDLITSGAFIQAVKEFKPD